MMKTTVCKKCGTGGLVWHKSKKGNWILVSPQSEVYEKGIGYWIEPHPCGQIAKIKQENIEYFEKQIELIKKTFAEHGVSQSVIDAEVAKYQEKIAVEKGWEI